MNFIQVVKPLPRLVGDALAARLRVMPAVVLTGARQTGKSTLVGQLVPGERRYRSLNDFDVRDAARRDPEALLGGDDPLTLDEEVDFVIEAGGKPLPIEVKATSKPRLADCTHLRTLRQE